MRADTRDAGSDAEEEPEPAGEQGQHQLQPARVRDLSPTVPAVEREGRRGTTATAATVAPEAEAAQSQVPRNKGRRLVEPPVERAVLAKRADFMEPSGR